MNATTAPTPTTQLRLATALAVAARREPPSRGFGTGYGRSSGYAAPRAYASALALTPFRLG